jgi:hypothetical protein
MNRSIGIANPAITDRGRWSRALRLATAATTMLVLFAAAPSSFAVKVLKDGGGADPDVQDRIDDAKGDLPKSPSGMATVRGSVYYNDRRIDGLFGDRRNLNTGLGGQQCKLVAAKPDCASTRARLAELREQQRMQVQLINDFKGGSIDVLKEQLARIDASIAFEEGNLAQCQGCGLNWLAGKYMVVDVLDHACNRATPLASATVGSNGAFSATFPISTGCSTVELRVRLAFCNDTYCFSINRATDDPYVLFHPGASASKPLALKAGDEITLNPLLFSTAADPGVPNDISIAANYYASVVDTVLSLHKVNPIPFYRAEFGELQYVFPSTESDTATTQSPSRVVISSFDSQPPALKGGFAWVEGKTPAHEYGHVMMQRAWGGSYGFDGIGRTVVDYEKAPEPAPQMAFKEAWAEFISRVVFKDSRGCHLAGFDKNGEIALDCSAISKKLATLRDRRQDQATALEAMQGHQGPGYALAQQQLKTLDEQIAAEERRLADCQRHPTAVDYSNSQTRNDDDLEDTDQNLKGALGEGTSWRDNIVKALCDWYDKSDDDDRNLAGRGDHFAAEDILSMWQNLRGMYTDASKYGGRYKDPGLWFCDWVRYYLDVRKSVAAVGATEHADYENKIRDLIYNNNIACSMPAPG